MRLFLCKDTEISVKMSVFIRDIDFYFKESGLYFRLTFFCDQTQWYQRVEVKSHGCIPYDFFYSKRYKNKIAGCFRSLSYFFYICQLLKNIITIQIIGFVIIRYKNMDVFWYHISKLRKRSNSGSKWKDDNSHFIGSVVHMICWFSRYLPGNGIFF